MKAIVVLGCGTIDGEPSPEAKLRVDCGIDRFKKSHDAVLVFSGECALANTLAISEAESMAIYARKKGIDKECIKLENRSRDTIGNAYFSRLLIDEHNITDVEIVTSYWHIPRVEYAFSRVFGSNYTLTFVPSKTCANIIERHQKERKFLELTRVFFEGIHSGDMQHILQRLLMQEQYLPLARKLI